MEAAVFPASDGGLPLVGGVQLPDRSGSGGSVRQVRHFRMGILRGKPDRAFFQYYTISAVSAISRQLDADFNFRGA